MGKLISIENVEPGMILAEPVINHYGQILIGQDAELSAKTIKVLKTWNIRSVKIKSDQNSEEPEIKEEILLLAKEKILQRIDWEPRNSNEIDLFHSSVLFTAYQLLKKRV